MTACEQCDMYGPEENTLQGDAIQLHRAVHDLGRAIRANWVPLTAWLTVVWLVTVGAAVIDHAL